MEGKKRCRWAENVEDIYVTYHDEEWGRALHDDQKLFEMLILEGFQAGLSWITILKKREAFIEAFDHFNPTIICQYQEDKIEELMLNQAIVRNKRKIIATIQNAKVYLHIQKEWGSFDAYLWHFTKGKIVYDHHHPIPTKTTLSDTISNDLKKRGMNFVGSTIIYAYLQAVGVVHSHEEACFLYKEEDE